MANIITLTLLAIDNAARIMPLVDRYVSTLKRFRVALTRADRRRLNATFRAARYWSRAAQ